MDDVREYLSTALEKHYHAAVAEGATPLKFVQKQRALHECLAYWDKVGMQIAQRVTDAECVLILVNAQTPQGRLFHLQGVIDVVDDGEATLYDIKTHDVDYVRGREALYAQQLRVYAHLYEKLRGVKIERTAIVATRLKKILFDAYQSNDTQAIEYLLGQWEPIVELPFEDIDLTETLNEFGAMVDLIEDGCFEPMPLEQISQKMPGMQLTYDQYSCKRCDIRFTCSSYLAYRKRYHHSTDDALFQLLLNEQTDGDKNERLDASLFEE